MLHFNYKIHLAIEIKNFNGKLLSYIDRLFFFELLRTCGGGGASGVMLANRLSPTTSRRPTLNPSSSFHNHHKHAKRIQQQSHQNEKEHILKPSSLYDNIFFCYMKKNI